MRKRIDLKIEKEMVDSFIISNRKERTLWELKKAHEKGQMAFHVSFLEPI